MEPHQCLRCRLWLRSARSAGKPYGPRCARRVTTAARVLEASGLPVAVRAAEALRDGALVPVRHRDVFRTVSSDGQRTYLTHPNGCNCQAGLFSRDCFHVMGAAILTGKRGRI
jgi:hypothetical protein